MNSKESAGGTVRDSKLEWTAETFIFSFYLKSKNHQGPLSTPSSFPAGTPVPLEQSMRCCEDSHGVASQANLARAQTEGLVTFWVSYLIATYVSQDSPPHFKLCLFSLFLKVQEGITAKLILKLEWNFIFPTEKRVKIRTSSWIHQWPGCASYSPDQKASQQSKFKYQECLICRSKPRNEPLCLIISNVRTLPSFKSGRRALLVFSASQPDSTPPRIPCFLPPQAVFLIWNPSELGTRPPALIPIICTDLCY